MLAGAPGVRPDTVFIDRYAEIAEYKKREAEAEAEAYKLKLREERAQQKLQLDEQVRLKQERIAREKANETQFIDFETERRARWNAVDAAKRLEMKEKEAAQRLAREAQVRDVKARKDTLARVEAQAQLDTLARIRDELAHERVLRAAHKMQEADNMRLVSAQNQKHLEMAAERRHQQFLDGQKVGIEYKKILDKQERDREDALAATSLRMRRQADATAHFYDAIAVEGKRDEERARAQQEADAAARDAELAARDERRKLLQKECNAILARQRAEGRLAGQRSLAEDAAMVRMEAAHNAAGLAADADEAFRRKMFESAYRKELAHQIKTDRVRKQMVGYTLPIAEMQMNSAMLRKIAQANLSDTRATGKTARSDYKVKTLDQLAGSH